MGNNTTRQELLDEDLVNVAESSDKLGKEEELDSELKLRMEEDRVHSSECLSIKNPFQSLFKRNPGLKKESYKKFNDNEPDRENSSTKQPSAHRILTHSATFDIIRRKHQSSSKSKKKSTKNIERDSSMFSLSNLNLLKQSLSQGSVRRRKFVEKKLSNEEKPEKETDNKIKYNRTKFDLQKKKKENLSKLEQEFVDLSLQLLEVDQCKTLGNALEKTETLKKFNFGKVISPNNGNDSVFDGLKHIICALQNNRTLESLSLSENCIGFRCIKLLKESLEINNTLTALDLSGCKIGLDSTNCQILGLGLDNSVLVDVDLSSCEIGDLGMKKLCSGMQHNHTIKKLKFERNFVAKEGSKALADLISTNFTLQEISLTKNAIDEVGCLYLGDSLSKNASLTKLEIKRNQISDEGFCFLLEGALAKTSKLKDLYLDNNHIGGNFDNPEKKNSFAKAISCLAINSNLKIVSLNANKLDNQDCITLMNLMYKNTTIHGLYLGGNPKIEGDSGIKTLTFMLKTNMSIVDLGIETAATEWKNLYKKNRALSTAKRRAKVRFAGHHLGELYSDLRISFDFLNLDVDVSDPEKTEDS